MIGSQRLMMRRSTKRENRDNKSVPWKVLDTSAPTQKKSNFAPISLPMITMEKHNQRAKVKEKRMKTFT